MSQMITNADGSQSEVFTKAEQDDAVKKATDTATKAATDASTKLVDEKIEEFKKQNPSGAEEIEKLKKSIEEKDGKIKELSKTEGDGDGDDDKNKGINEEQIKRLKKEREEGEEKLTKKIEDMTKSLQAVTGDVKDELIGKAVNGASESDLKEAGGAEEFQKKLELKFDSFAGEAITRTQIAERIGESVTLVTGNKPSESLMDNSTSSGAKGDEDHKGNQPKEVSEITKKVGTGLGISEEDRKTFGPGGEKDKASTSSQD